VLGLGLGFRFRVRVSDYVDSVYLPQPMFVRMFRTLDCNRQNQLLSRAFVFMNRCRIRPLISDRMRPAGRQLLTIVLSVAVNLLCDE